MGNPDRPLLSDLTARLAKARRDQAEAESRRRGPALGPQGGSAYGAAWRIAVELVAGLAVGAGMGWLLDELFGTSPWLMIVFFFLGAGAGIRGVYRVAQQINATAQDDASRHDETKD